MYHDLTKGNISRSLLLFALPMMAGNLLQQFYNIADTLIVGRVLGNNALAAVGSAYTLMTFLTSIFLGLALRCVIFDLSGPTRHGQLKVCDCSLVCADCTDHTDCKRNRLSLYGADFILLKGSGRCH